ncbi:hypothetical protein L208DRAFT_797360 [Tricholoma matsutake]|nr:hypothetical protein L208DRAFT_349404 [Tricholoma matsutake 945]KAF8234850.1 hypothetical protein L208DRAFT_797360 [Tricholoma matsutake 945]
MLPTEWTDAKDENTCRGDGPPDSRAKSTPFPESSSAAERSIPLESKHTFQARTQVPTPPDRQRTAQACDKCRERKTKCSGDHPVCSRCTTRGLICQYSSREPRPRGPSKARSRTISSLDLHPPPKANNSIPARQEPQRVQGHPEKPMPAQFYSRAFVGGGHSDRIHHRPSIPHSSHSFSEFSPIPMNGSAAQEFCGMNLLGYEPSHGAATTRPQQTTEEQFTDHNQQHLQHRWSDVQRLQSHITSEEDATMRFGLHTPPPLPMAGSNSYGPFSSQGRVSPTFQHPLPLLERASVGQFEPQKNQHVEQMYSWGYHSDSGSSGSSIGESLTYSPISSEDAPEPRSRSTSSHGFRSSALDLAQANTSHHQRQFQYSALDDGTAYSSLAFLPFGQFHNVALDPEQEIQAGVDFTYPSPIASIGVNILQEELSFKQGFFDYLGVESRTRGEGSKFIEKDIGHPIEAVN